MKIEWKIELEIYYYQRCEYKNSYKMKNGLHFIHFII